MIITKTLIINGVECTQPQRKPLNPNEQYFLADPTSADMYSGAFIWDDNKSDNMWLKHGIVYRNKEDAIKVAAALLMPLKTTKNEIPELNEGERYAGIVIDSATGQPTHHLILLPGKTKSIAWPDALTWAEQAGGALPTRQEQALLYANLKPHFKGAWYWSSEQHAGNEPYAWFQNFDNGNQDLSRKYTELRARAVRRVPITEN